MVLDSNGGLFRVKTSLFVQDENPKLFSFLIDHPVVRNVQVNSDHLLVESEHESETLYYLFLNSLRSKFTIPHVEIKKDS